MLLKLPICHIRWGGWRWGVGWEYKYKTRAAKIHNICEMLFFFLLNIGLSGKGGLHTEYEVSARNCHKNRRHLRLCTVQDVVMSSELFWRLASDAVTSFSTPLAFTPPSLMCLFIYSIHPVSLMSFILPIDKQKIHSTNQPLQRVYMYSSIQTQKCTHVKSPPHVQQPPFSFIVNRIVLSLSRNHLFHTNAGEAYY